jgi:hypothetical protein
MKYPYFQMDDDRQGAPGGGRRPWDKQSVMNPYRDDPPARPVADGVQETSVTYWEECDEQMDTRLAATPDSVCTCGGMCPTMKRTEEQKCCGEVPDWQEKYNHTGDCDMAWI